MRAAWLCLSRACFPMRRAMTPRREIDDVALERVIEEGEVKRKGDVDMWIFMRIEGRSDNLVRAAVVEAAALGIKTVMINWELEDEQ